ncbi:hypothetical protein D9615_004834 [Tricholomella constricta]|uniref:DUF7330 domain-containing protein n=1 Tax=Tricholomella constricta TaxID=117010 RepID=A0A8H5HH18_9AGAR|nr:hypothetical protein D9615_004834 [Tricholomella constricta]
MAPSLTDQSSAPPGYTSQLGGTSPIQSLDTDASTEDLVSAQSHPLPSPSVESATPRPSDVHFNYAASPRRASSPRRRYTSLPYSSSSITFPPHLQYHHVPGTSISTAGPSDSFPPDTSLSSFQQKVASRSTVRLNPTNYVSLSRKSTPHKRFLSLYRTSASIKGDFTVNPYLHIPAALLSPASPSARDDQGRKNLRFEVENGGIDVNIFLIGEPTPDGATTALRTTLDLRIRGNEGTTFPLIAKIHTPMLLRPPFHLSAAGIDGYHALHLPPSFHGLVTIKVAAGDLDAHISLSRGFASNSMILSESATARSYFVGELGGWARDKQGWEGDRVDASISRGMVRLQILGERENDGLRRMRWRMGF